MSHYFKDIEHSEEDYFFVESYINGKKYKFQSCNNIFSKNEVDYGTNLLIKTVIKNFDDLGQKVLDLGCGYGAIGISLADYYKYTHFVMSDVTKTATRLAKHNLYLNSVENAEVVNSNLFEKINSTFDFIITNPPIKVGKQVLLSLIEGSLNKLDNEGRLILVIKKKHGKDSIKKHMETVFGNCDILERDKGYYILSSQKFED
jgi:16S rRNA (guanine1207-N2)-methyltransferase